MNRVRFVLPCSSGGRRARGQFNAGFTLVELMISVVLGLIVTAGVISVFLGTQQSYRANKALGSVQQASRNAFDLMSGDIREAGFTGCDSSGYVANVLKNGPNNSGTDWWANWANAVHGYTQGAATDAALTVQPVGTSGTPTTLYDQVAGTDSLQLVGADNESVSVSTHVPLASTFTLNEPTAQVHLVSGDVIVVCDPNHAVITQITSYTPSAVTLTTAAAVGTPGNCSINLGDPTSCAAGGGTSYTYRKNSVIAKLTASDWYIGYYNATQGKSLFRLTLQTDSSSAAKPVMQEMVRGVTGMSLAYHVSGSPSFVTAASVSAADWSKVDSVQVNLTLLGSTQPANSSSSGGNQLINRTYTSTSTIRNRVK